MRESVFYKELFRTRTFAQGARSLASILLPYEPRRGINEISFHLFASSEMILPAGTEVEATNAPLDEVPVKPVFSMEPILLLQCLRL